MQKFTCKKCEAELYWDSKTGGLKCEYCDSIYQPEEFNETDEQSGTFVKDEHINDGSDGFTMVKYKCDECGAAIVTAAGTLATTCAHCGRALSMNKKMEGVFKPDLVVPFRISKKEAKNIFTQYCSSSLLVPKEFKDEKNLKKFRGVYMPFWLHSFRNDANASFLCENTTTSRRGDDKIITHHKYRVDMESHAFFEQVPTDALKRVDNNLMDSLEPFDYEEIEVFHPGYMAGFYAEEYDDDVATTFPRVRKRAADAMSALMRQRVGMYSSITLDRYNDNPSEHHSDYAMLPVWLLTAEYNKRKYTFAINGSTGKIVGKLPVDIKFTTLLSIGVALASYLLINIIGFFLL